jgi:hypothetical protein
MSYAFVFFGYLWNDAEPRIPREYEIERALLERAGFDFEASPWRDYPNRDESRAEWLSEHPDDGFDGWFDEWQRRTGLWKLQNMPRVKEYEARKHAHLAEIKAGCEIGYWGCFHALNPIVYVKRLYHASVNRPVSLSERLPLSTPTPAERKALEAFLVRLGVDPPQREPGWYLAHVIRA